MNRDRVVKLKDIADAAGVAVATVSAALNGTGTVSNAMRERVRKVAAEMNYEPNMAAKLLKQKKVNFFEAVYLLQPEKSSVAERRIMKLVLQTPLSVPELVRCFENNVRDVSSADKVISAIYTEESDNQARLNNASSLSDYRHDVLEATANLYLTRQVILEHA